MNTPFHFLHFLNVHLKMILSRMQNVKHVMFFPFAEEDVL